MAERGTRPGRTVHRGVWFVAAAVMAWLVFQNSMLLIWFSSAHLEPLFVVARAMMRVGIHLAASYWMVPAAVFLGVALALTGVPTKDDRRVREVRHV